MSDDDDEAIAVWWAGVAERAAADPNPFIPRSRERSPERIAADAEARRRHAADSRDLARDLWKHEPEMLAAELERIAAWERADDERDAAEAVQPGPAGPN